jgi:glycine dehydrogenase subunit 1
MRYIPHTEQDIGSMLAVLGLGSVDELFSHLPDSLRAQAHIALPPGVSEAELRNRLTELADQNLSESAAAIFLGAGAYPHGVPAVVDQIIQRGEFATAYTPYQPEVSQGTLQAVFEFQSLIAALLGLDVANASMYDGASATAEAVLMAKRILPKRSTVLVSRALHPQYRQVMRTYLEGFPGVRLRELPWAEDGRLDRTALERELDENVIGAVVGYPNVFGIVEDVAAISQAVRQHGGLTISATTESLALGLLKSPGELGTDIAVAEGQSLGIPMSYGGPGIGLFACRQPYLRNMPGRLVGETLDHDGRRGFVLTLATREQHIRRQRATSNICTNQGLCALAVTVFLCLLGRQGLRRLARQNVTKSHYARDLLTRSGRCQARFSAPFFNEFVLRVANAEAVWQRLKAEELVAGLPLHEWYPELSDCLLVCVTETHPRTAIERLARSLGADDEAVQ